MTYDDALDVALLLKDGPTAMVNQNMCFAPGSLTIERALMVENRVGPPSYGQLMMQYQFDTDYHPWFGRDERWWTVGLTVHHLGLLQLLFGPPRSVYGLLGRDVSQPGVLYEGYGHLSLSYPDGLQVLIVSTGTYYGVHPVRHGAEQGWVQGPQGLLDWSPAGPVTFSTRADEGTIAREELEVRSGTWFPDAFGLTMAHLQEAEAKRVAPLCSVSDNLYVAAAIEAVYRSSAERRNVEIQEIMGESYDPTYGTGWSHGYGSWAPPAPVVSEDVVV
jgi:predicted dehydrogenase